jgi:ribosomal protein L34
MEKNEATAEAPVSDRDMPRCVDCSAVAPPTGTNYTLISARFGWRLTRMRTQAGRKVMEWRCPSCFSRSRAREGA